MRYHSVHSAVRIVCRRILRSLLPVEGFLSNLHLVHYNFLIRFDTARLAVTLHALGGTRICLDELWIMVLDLVPCGLIRRIVVGYQIVWGLWGL